MPKKSIIENGVRVVKDFDVNDQNLQDSIKSDFDDNLAARTEATNLILSANFVGISLTQLETAIAGETPIVKKLSRVLWALMQEKTIDG